MNIALFPSAFHPSLGGVEELSRQLAKELDRTGHRVEIFTNRWPKNLPKSQTFEGLPLHRYDFRVPERSARQLGGALLFGSMTARRLRADLLIQRAEILHVQCVSSNAYYALRAKRRLGLPLVLTLQGELTMDAGQLFQRSRFAQQLLRSTLDDADMITACSSKTLADAEAFYGKSFGDRGRVIFNGANTADFSAGDAYSHSRPYVFALGRLVAQKGFDLLIRAFKAASDDAHVRRHDLLIAGDGSEMESLKNLARDLGLADHVHLLGRADRRMVASLLRGCSFFAIPSRADEGFPVVCAEAMAAGKAVLATRVGGVPEAVIHDVTGVMIPNGDLPAMATSIAVLCGNATRCEQFGSAGRIRARQFSWEIISGQYCRVYAEAMGRASGSALSPHLQSATVTN